MHTVILDLVYFGLLACFGFSSRSKYQRVVVVTAFVNDSWRKMCSNDLMLWPLVGLLLSLACHAIEKTTTKNWKNQPPIKMFGTTQRTKSNICQGLRIWKNVCHFYNSTTSLQLASTHALENPKLILPDTFFIEILFFRICSVAGSVGPSQCMCQMWANGSIRARLMQPEGLTVVKKAWGTSQVGWERPCRPQLSLTWTRYHHGQ